MTWAFYLACGVVLSVTQAMVVGSEHFLVMMGLRLLEGEATFRAVAGEVASTGFHPGLL